MMNRGMVYKLTRVATEQEYRDYLNAINNDEFNAARDSIVIDERGVAILNPTPRYDENRPRLDKLEYYWLKDDKRTFESEYKSDFLYTWFGYTCGQPRIRSK